MTPSLTASFFFFFLMLVDKTLLSSAAAGQQVGQISKKRAIRTAFVSRFTPGLCKK